LYSRCMTEQARPHETHEHEDPEIQAISERLGVVIDVLGFEETGEIARTRAAFIKAVDDVDVYDPDIPDHVRLFGEYLDAGQQSLVNEPEPEPRIGFEIAQLRLWLDCGEPYEFYNQLGGADHTGVVAMLGNTPGLDACLVELTAIVDDLKKLDKPQTQQPTKSSW